MRLETANDPKLSDGGGLAARLLRWVCVVAAGMTARSRSLQRMVRRRFIPLRVTYAISCLSLVLESLAAKASQQTSGKEHQGRDLKQDHLTQQNPSRRVCLCRTHHDGRRRKQSPDRSAHICIGIPSGRYNASKSNLRPHVKRPSIRMLVENRALRGRALAILPAYIEMPAVFELLDWPESGRHSGGW